MLEIYAARHCLGTPEALRLAGEVKRRMPQLRLNLRMIDDMQTNTVAVFATPSYYLNGRLLFLGNPGPDELIGKLRVISGTIGERNTHEQS